MNNNENKFLYDFSKLKWYSKKDDNFNWPGNCVSNTCCVKTEYYAFIKIHDVQISWIIFICDYHLRSFKFHIENPNYKPEPLSDEEFASLFGEIMEKIQKKMEK